MSPPATAARETYGTPARPHTWTRAAVIEAIQRWHAAYGEPPRAADWNPSAAKWSAQEWRVARYRAGDPVTGAPWPSLNAAKRVFDGSLNKAVIAAGFTPTKPGPTRRKDVDMKAVRTGMTPDARVALEAMEAEVKAAHAKVASVERQLVAARERAAVATEKARVRPERVVDHTAVRKAEERAQARGDRAVRAAAKESAQAAALVVSVRQEHRATVRDFLKMETRLQNVQDEKAQLRSRLKKAERLLEETRGVALEPVQVERVVEKVVTKTVEVPGPGSREIAEAHRETRQALARTAQAERDAARAQADYMELAAAATGEARKLSRAEINALRENGPTGPALVGAGLKKLALARKSNNPEALRVALKELASAAVSWAERL